MSLRLLPMIIAASCLLCFGVAQAGGRGSSKNFDARVEHNRRLGSADLSVLEAERPKGASVRRDRITGGTRSLFRPTGYLSASSLPGHDPASVALSYLEANRQLLGLSEVDLADAEITGVVHSRATGATRVYLRQRYQGLSVYGAQLQVNLSRDGRVLGVSNRFLPEIAEAGTGRSPTPRLDADRCAAAAGESLGIAARSRPKIAHRGRGRGRRTRLSWEEISGEPVTSRLMWLPIRAGDLRLVWNLQLQPAQAQRVGPKSFFDFNVDASSGKVWTRFDWTFGAEYRVYPQPVESPNHSLPLPPADGRALVLDPADLVASPPVGTSRVI